MMHIAYSTLLISYHVQIDLANRSVRVMGQNGFGSKRANYKKGCFGSGRNGFGSERVQVETGPGNLMIYMCFIICCSCIYLFCNDLTPLDCGGNFDGVPFKGYMKCC
ncbi:hypothetical protein HanOQP8_Chr02g0076781 [Helianthus annuus]|nr:hypothetical protein HanLR1_Chr02g0065881 [Helianthus annuus]KAJ0786922.1 hypothetical protein HanOQP8_Chr02g0076781 [Helianthus annuus]